MLLTGNSSRHASTVGPANAPRNMPHLAHIVVLKLSTGSDPWTLVPSPRRAWALVMSRPRDPSTTTPVLGASLRDGRRHSCMVLLGRIGGEGKSFLLAPLRALYGQGQVQSTPQHGNFPFLGLETKKVVLMDDCCGDDSVLPLPTQLLWYEGEPFLLSQPQNTATTRCICCMKEQRLFSSR